MSDTPKLGRIIEPGRVAGKDATHIAIAPVTAHFILRPGDHVGVCDGVTKYDDPCGIVDPFLRKCVEKGQIFWIFLYPDSTASLRHEWDHPAFPNPKTEEEESYYDDGCGGCNE